MIRRFVSHTKRRVRDLSIQRKLTLIVTAVTSFSLILAFTAYILYDFSYFKRSTIQRFFTLAEMVALNSTASLSFNNPQDAKETLSALRAEKNVEVATVYDTNGREFANYKRVDHAGQEETEKSRGLPRGRDIRMFVYSGNSLHVYLPIELEGARLGTLYIQADMAELRARVRRYTTIAIGVGAISLILALLLAARLQRWISRPIMDLVGVAHKVSESRNYTVRARESGKDETGVLVKGFNDMLSQIQSRDYELRSAHEQLERHAAELQTELIERQRAEAETIRVKEFLQDVINSTPVPLVAVDAAGRITLWNRLLERETGRSGTELVQALAWAVIPILADHSGVIMEAIRSGSLQKLERLVCHHCDTQRYMDVLVYPLHGEEAGAVIRIDDVTEEVRMLELMAQTEKMMSVGGLAAGMAHEINNPLGIIVQSVQNIQRRISPDLAKNAEVAQEVGVSVESIRHYFEKRDIPALIRDIQDAGKRAATIVTNMLNFSRRSSSGMLPASIGDLIRKSVELAANDYDLKKKYYFRHISIEYEIDPALPLVPCIESKLEQVILNLLKNAAQAIGEHKSNGAPTITCRAVQEPGYVRIEIEDNGPGMTEEVRRRVFEPFFTTKEVGTGTGLGLSVSYFIVKENHDGTMSVESAPGKGTTFMIRLPLEHKTLARAEEGS